MVPAAGSPLAAQESAAPVVVVAVGSMAHTVAVEVVVVVEVAGNRSRTRTRMAAGRLDLVVDRLDV